MNQRPKVIALTKYARRGASSRVRIWNLVPDLEANGWEVTVIPLLSDEVLAEFYSSGKHNYFRLVWRLLIRINKLIQLGPTQVIWVEKELLHGFPSLFESLLVGSRMASTVFDYDDAVFLNYSDDWLGRLGRSAKFAHYARTAAYVTVGSESLHSTMTNLGCCHIRRIPSTVAVGSYPLHEHRADSVIVIGWIGTPKTVHFLEALRDVMPVVAKRFSIQMHVVGAKWDCPGVDVRSLPWSEDTETTMVGRFDIGVMPLIDGPWERAKCGYKLIQYMAAGVVPMGARVGENKILIQDGVNGYLASQSEEWIEKLVLLCGNAQLRSAVGARARETALQKYDVRIAAKAVHEVFTEVVSRRTRGPQ